MDAEISSVTDNTVRLQLPDRRIVTIAYGDFCVEDQAYVKEWAINDAQKRDGVFRVKLQTFRKSHGTDKTMPSVRIWDAGYRITLTSLVSCELDDLVLQYYLFHPENLSDARAASMGLVSRATGEISLPKVRARGDCTVETKALQIMPTEGYVIEGGQRRNVDELRGVWLRVYRNGVLLFEHNSYPKSSANEMWPAELRPPKRS